MSKRRLDLSSQLW